MTASLPAVESPAFPTTAPTDPAVGTASYVSLASLFVSGLVVLGVPVTADQKVWIIGAVALLGPVIAGVLIRRRVFSPATVEQMVDELVRQAEEAKDAMVAARAESKAQEIAHAAALQAVTSVAQSITPVTPLPPPYARQEPPMALPVPYEAYGPTRAAQPLAAPYLRPTPPYVPPSGRHGLPPNQRP